MKFFKRCFLILIFLFILPSVIMAQNVEVIGIVKDVIYCGPGWASAGLTIVKFDDGRVLPFSGIEKGFIINRKTKIIYYQGCTQHRWIVRKVIIY